MPEHDTRPRPARPLLGDSQVMRDVFRAVRELAPTDTPVLLQGETGTGKTVIAEAIHALSLRRDKPLADIHAGPSSDFFWRDLLGVAPEASPIPAMRGLFERAAGGSVLIEEVGELPDDAQAEVLRVIRSGCVRRVGGEREIPVTFRLLCTTQQDLRSAVAAGRFREELYSAIAENELTIPPLRDRVSDIRALAERAMRDQIERCRPSGEEYCAKALSPEAVRLLERQPWPGNVRELTAVVVRAVVLAETAIIGPDDLTFGPLSFVEKRRPTRGPGNEGNAGRWN